MRRMLLTLVSAALLLSAAGAAQAMLLYPNLKTLPPRYLRFDYTDVSADGSGVLHHVLRFSNTAYNTGEGPLEIRATIDMSRNPPSGPAYQRVYDSGGSYTDIPLTGGTLYYHAIHKHYHFDNWGAYQLWTKAAYDNWVSSGVGSPDLVGTKTTSCVEDEELVTPIASAVWPAQYPSSKCLPDASNVIAEGLSPGWGDTYDYYRSEQWIDLGSKTLPDGTYVLRSIADPDNIVYESPSKATGSRESPADNAATTTFTVSGGQIIDSDPPTGTVTINHIATLTTSPNVSLDILGRDDVSGVDQFQVSNDGAHWATYSNSSYDSVPQTISWDLTNATYGGTTATGTKTVSVRFHDSAGHWGPAATDTITYDPNPPPAVQTSPYGKAVQSDGPVSWWRLGETAGTAAADEERVNPGTYVGGVTRGAPSLLPMDAGNSAAAFDGSSGRVAVPDANSLDIGSHLTLEAWIKFSAPLPASGFASILSKAESYSLQFDGPALEFTIIETAGGTRHRLQAPTTIVPGDVYHVVGTYDGTTQRLYVNGQQVASGALSGVPTVTTNPLYVGSWDGTKEYFHGVIDEPAVYHTTLSAARVAAHYDAATKPTLTSPTGLAATPASTSAIDLSWTNTSTGETHELLERSRDASFSSVTTITLPAGTHAYHDTGLAPGTLYWYRVKATTATDSSPYSTPAQTATLAPATYASTVLGDHPVSYWRLDETSGSVAGDQRVANPGVFIGGPILGVPGLIATDPTNPAVGFNGTTSDVRIGQAGSLNASSALSIEAWIKPASLPAAGRRRAIFAKTGAYALELNGAQLELSVLELGTRVSVDAPAGTIVAGYPAYVVGTYDGATLRLYVNGVAVASRATSGAADQTLRGAHIGSWDGASELFAGTIDEVALYATPLSAAQVAAHYAQGGAVPTPPPPASTPPPVVTSPPAIVHALRLTARVRPSHVRLRHGRTNATLVLRASARARVRLTLISLTTGIRHGRRCVVAHRRGRRCTLARAIGSRALVVRRGRMVLALPVRYGRARLTRGRWQLLISARHATPVRVTFTVVR